jgi:hypothetical protein
MTETIHASDKYLILFNAYCAFIQSICDWLLCREPSIACVGQWLMMGLSVLRWLMSSADHRRCRFIRLPLRRLVARSWHNIDFDLIAIAKRLCCRFIVDHQTSAYYYYLCISNLRLRLMPATADWSANRSLMGGSSYPTIPLLYDFRSQGRCYFALRSIMVVS